MYDAVPAIQGQLYDALLANLMDKLTRHTLAEFNRGGTGSPFEAATYVPIKVTNESLDSAWARGRHADSFYTAIPIFRKCGVPETTLTRMIDWGASMWPAGNWAAIRPGGALALP